MIAGHRKIQAEYRRLDRETLKVWEAHPLAGKEVGPAYSETALGLTVGSTYRPRGRLLQVWRQLEKLCAGRPELDLVPFENLHFTFLSLSDMAWEDATEVPEDCAQLFDLVKGSVGRHRWELGDLRLVALPRSLLLVGFPDEQSLLARAKACKQILGSPWAPYLKEAYGSFPIPPLLWHSALVRTRCEFLPPELRAFRQEIGNENLGDLDLGVPKPYVVNYNWVVKLDPRQFVGHRRG